MPTIKPCKKAKKATSMMKRARAELDRLGFVNDVVERRIPHSFVTKDFLGFADIIYVTSGSYGSIVALQVTTNTGGHHAKHKEKIIAEPRALAWLQAGGLVELWSFAKQGPRGEAKTWKIRKEEIVQSDFDAQSTFKK